MIQNQMIINYKFEHYQTKATYIYLNKLAQGENTRKLKFKFEKIKSTT